jgi:hypothetical protein
MSWPVFRVLGVPALPGEDRCFLSGVILSEAKDLNCPFFASSNGERL